MKIPDVKSLTKIKEDLEKKKAAVLTLNGNKNAKYEQLKKDFNCGTFEEGDEKFKKMEEELKEANAKLSAGIESLKKEYPLDNIE